MQRVVNTSKVFQFKFDAQPLKFPSNLSVSIVKLDCSKTPILFPQQFRD